MHWDRNIGIEKSINAGIHYNCLKNKYDNKSRVLFTDTDYLMYEIRTKDVYEDFSGNKIFSILVIIWLSENERWSSWCVAIKELVGWNQRFIRFS